MIRIRDRLDAPDHVLDASLLLMQVHEEPGWQGALSLIGGSIISSIN